MGEIVETILVSPLGGGVVAVASRPQGPAQLRWAHASNDQVQNRIAIAARFLAICSSSSFKKSDCLAIMFFN